MQTNEQPYRGQRTTTLLDTLLWRISDLCTDAGREDLAEVIGVVQVLAEAHPDFRAMRERFRDILERDDALLDMAATLDQRQRQWKTVAGLLEAAQ